MFRSIALGGGGVRGGLHVGALAALEEHRGSLNFPDGVYGSSIGAIVATAVAFNLSSQQIRTMFDTYLNLEDILGPLRLASFQSMWSRKGLFSMDRMEERVTAAFASQSVELKGKTLGDAPQPLYIVASNMTTQTPTLFAKDVPLLEALKCSCCLPMVFPPQILYNQVYLDGGVLVDCLAQTVPADCLVFHISEPSTPVYPSEIADLSLPNYLYRVYRTTRSKPTNTNLLWLREGTIGLLQDLTLEDKQRMYDEGFSQTRTFLAKRTAKEL